MSVVETLSIFIAIHSQDLIDRGRKYNSSAMVLSSAFSGDWASWKNIYYDQCCGWFQVN